MVSKLRARFTHSKAADNIRDRTFMRRGINGHLGSR